MKRLHGVVGYEKFANIVKEIQDVYERFGSGIESGGREIENLAFGRRSPGGVSQGYLGGVSEEGTGNFSADVEEGAAGAGHIGSAKEAIRATEEGRVTTKEEAAEVSLYTGIPVSVVLSGDRSVFAMWQKYIGNPVWDFFMNVPVWLGKRNKVIDKINRGLMYNYRKDPDYADMKDDSDAMIQTYRERAKEMAAEIAKLSRPEQARVAQIIEGSVTEFPAQYKNAIRVIKEFERLEKELTDLGILKDHRFRQLSRKEIAGKMEEVRKLENEIMKKRQELEPIVSLRRLSRRVGEEITEEVVGETVTGMGDVATSPGKMFEQNEKRVLEALVNRGFHQGEAETMVGRIKESVSEIKPGKKEGFREIRKTIEKRISQVVREVWMAEKKYSPEYMARAKREIVKDIKKKHKERGEILTRIRTHYRMSGKRYLRHIYDRVDRETKFQEELENRIKRNRLKLTYTKRRKEHIDLQKLMRRGVPEEVLRGLSDEAHDAEMMKMFNRIAENPDWAISPEEYLEIQARAKEKGKDTPKSRKYAEFRAVPDGIKLGKLSGFLVSPEIFEELQEGVEVRSDMLKAYDEAMQFWKYGKVVLNPATHMRNVMSNAVLAYFGDLNPARVDIYMKAAKELKTRGEYYKEAKNENLFGVEWANVEVVRFLDELAKNEKAKNVFEAMGKVGRKFLDMPSDAYQGIEQYFKLAVYINERQKGRTAREAKRHAEKYLFNYQKIPSYIRKYKRVSPFITFTYKALPIVSETAVKKPWKIASVLALMKTVELIGAALMGEPPEEIEKETRVLPAYMKKPIFPGFISHLRLPYRDEHGRSKWLDLSYILPWGDVAEQWGQTTLVARSLLPNNPLATFAADWYSNQVAFSGQPLTLGENDPDYWKKIGTHLWRQAMPSLAGGYGFDKLMSAIYGDVDWAGRERSVEEAIFDVFLGIKIRSVDYNEEFAFRLREKRRTIQDLRFEYKKELRAIIRSPRGEDKDRERQIDLMKKYDKQINRIVEEINGLTPEEGGRKRRAPYPAASIFRMPERGREKEMI
jgi:hypothetical protein